MQDYKVWGYFSEEVRPERRGCLAPNERYHIPISSNQSKSRILQTTKQQIHAKFICVLVVFWDQEVADGFQILCCFDL